MFKNKNTPTLEFTCKCKKVVRKNWHIIGVNFRRIKWFFKYDHVYNLYCNKCSHSWAMNAADCRNIQMAAWINEKGGKKNECKR